MVVDKHLTHLCTLYIVPLYILNAFCRIELDDVWLIKRPDGGIIGVG